MTTPSHPSPEDRAREIVMQIADCLGKWPWAPDAERIVTAALHAHGLAERRAGAETAAKVADKKASSLRNASESTLYMPARDRADDYAHGRIARSLEHQADIADEIAAAIRALPLPGDDT